MDNGDLNQDLIRYTVPENENDKGANYGAIDKNEKEDTNQNKGPMNEKERNVMLMIMGVVSFLGYTQFSMVGPFYPQYVSLIYFGLDLKLCFWGCVVHGLPF